MADGYRFGIEEEYFLADAESGRSPAGSVADAFHKVAGARVEPASHELLKGQIEVCTEPGTDHDAARQALHGMRTRLSALASDHGLRVFAAGSHPLAHSGEQETTEQERYQRLEQEFGLIASRAMVCAMHVHVEVPEPRDRIDLIRRMLPWLPMFLGLSVSSPFWQGKDSGLSGFRLCAFSEWPRMGLPELFTSQREYEAFVDLMVQTGRIKDASFIWWYLRPSTKFPTIELRICDSCTNVDDAVAVAALYRSLVRTLVRRPELGAEVATIDRGICAENVWQAQRTGFAAQFIDKKSRRLRALSEIVEETLDLVAEDAEALGCRDWIGRVRRIGERGTSADQQLALWHAENDRGVGREAALRTVVADLAKRTIS